MLPDIERCKGYAKSGTRCKRRQSKGYLCWQHAQSEYGIRVKKSLIPGAGWGLIDQNREIHTGQVIVPYQGTRMTEHQYQQYHNHTYGVEVSANAVIVPEKSTTSFGPYANTYRARNRAPGTYRNNAKLSYNARSRLVNLRAIHPIHPGQEVLTGYGRAYRF